MIACLENRCTPAGANVDDDPAIEAIVAWRERGDQAAARRIVEQLTPLVRGIAFRSLPRPWMVDDAVQNTLSNVFRSLDKFDHRVPLTAWAVCLSRNVCKDMLRRWHHRSVFPAAEMGIEKHGHEERGNHGPSLDEVVMAREELRHAFQCIASLDETDRRVINLLFMDGCSAADVALRTGLSAGAVRVRAFRIRNVLREEMSREKRRYCG
jgi:RNA polymerase sigma-70 factor (ECF subfamily)